MPDIGSTLKSTPRRRGITDMSLASVDMFSSENETATRPVRFSKLASNSWRNVRVSS